jgi:hypothetical protein
MRRWFLVLLLGIGIGVAADRAISDRPSTPPPQPSETVEVQLVPVEPLGAGKSTRTFIDVGSQFYKDLASLSDGGVAPACQCQNLLTRQSLWCEDSAPVCDPETASRCEKRYAPPPHRCYAGVVVSMYWRRR